MNVKIAGSDFRKGSLSVRLDGRRQHGVVGGGGRHRTAFLSATPKAVCGCLSAEKASVGTAIAWCVCGLAEECEEERERGDGHEDLGRRGPGEAGLELVLSCWRLNGKEAGEDELGRHWRAVEGGSPEGVEAGLCDDERGLAEVDGR